FFLQLRSILTPGLEQFLKLDRLCYMTIFSVTISTDLASDLIKSSEFIWFFVAGFWFLVTAYLFPVASILFLVPCMLCPGSCVLCLVSCVLSLFIIRRFFLYTRFNQ